MFSSMKKTVAVLAAAFALGATAQAQSLQEGLRLVDVERFGDASRTFSQLLATAPTPDNYFYAGFAYAAAEKNDSAIAMWTQAGAGDPKNAMGKVALGSAEVLKGNAAGAKVQFEEARKLSKNKNAEVLYRIGQAFTIYPTKDAGEAITNLTKAAELNKTRADILTTLGDAYLIMNDGSAAATNYDRAIRVAPKYTKAYVRIGQVYENARSFKEAYNKYMEGVNQDSSYTPVYRYLAELQRKGRQQSLAIANYRKYISRSDRNPEVLLRFAGFLIEAGQFQEAAQYVAEAEGKTKSPLFYRLKAYTLYETGDAAGSETALTTFINTTDTTKTKIIGRDYFYLGKAGLATSKDTAKAIALMKQGIAKDTNLREPLKDLGDSAFAKKQYRAATVFRQAYVSTLATPAVNDYFQLGQAAFFGKDYKVADEAFAKVTEVSQGRAPAGLFYRGYVAMSAEPKSNKAAGFFTEFLKVTSDTSKVPASDAPKFTKQRATAYAILAREAAVKNDFKDALHLANMALKEDPANTQAPQIIKSIEAAEAAKKKAGAPPTPPTPPTPPAKPKK